MRKHLYLFCLVTLWSAAFAQSKRLLLHNATYSVEAINNDQIIAASLLGYDAETERNYGILVLKSSPSPDFLNRLKQADVVLYEALPESAYLIGVPQVVLKRLLTWPEIQNFIEQPKASKFSKRLAASDYPNWMWMSTNIAEFRVHAVADAYLDKVEMAFEKLGFSIKTADRQYGTYTLHGALSQIEPLRELPQIIYIQEAEEPGEPENHNGRAMHRINAIQPNIQTGYNGQGIVVALGDDGAIGPHIDYEGRLISRSGPSGGNHGDHVAGTIFGAGNRDPRGTGMAPGAQIIYYDYPDNISNADNDYVQDQVRITSSSYSNGCNAGYTSFTNQVDRDSRDNLGLLHVFSAGNNGTQNCGFGAGNGWGNITGGHKMGKNVIAVANVTSTDQIANSSSRGPANDGRVKPEISAIGTDVYSTYDPHTYGNSTGTSMACPGVSGALAVMYSAYQQNYNALPDGGLMKAIALNTAQDLGNPGPDFLFGYGRLHLRHAIQVIEDGMFIKDSVISGQQRNFNIQVPSGIAELKALVYWVDPAASPIAQKALVNNLDMVMSGPGGSWQPWVLNPSPNVAALSSPAVRATDSLNNQEQITLTNPTSGNYTLNITGSSVLSGGQVFYVTWILVPDQIVVDWPLENAVLVPGRNEIIRWDAPSGTSTFNVEFSLNGGQTWNTINANLAGSARTVSWTPPFSTTGEARIRVSRGSASAQTGNFNLIGRPGNFQIDYVCPDSLRLSWTPVLNATHYDVFVLGSMYMDSLTTVNTNQAVISGLPITQDHWFSVRARRDSTVVGERVQAILKNSGSNNCILNYDLAAFKLASPQSGTPTCQSNNLSPKIEVLNQGLQAINGFSANLEFNVSGGGTLAFNQSFGDTVFPNQSKILSFTNLLNLPAGLHSYRLIIQVNNDQNAYNDTLMGQVEIFNSGPLQTLPGGENFDGMNTCATSTDCELTSCSLSNGWFNLGNGQGDDIDWRVHVGSTATTNTGPTGGQGGGGSQYLYLESSGGCNFAEAILVSPCIDLNNSISPIFSFWYHMYGANMGNLRVEVLADGEVYPNVFPVINGNQGNQWLQGIVDLSPFVNKIINLRIIGTTGSGFTSDLAIDQMEWRENNAAPTASLGIPTQAACTGQAIDFEDLSTFAPNQWLWKFSPNTVSFVNNTSAQSQNPSVVFNQVGTYSIKLIASNVFGSDSVEVPNAIVISNGMAPAVSENFESNTSVFPPQGFELINPDADQTWRAVSVVGSQGLSSRTAQIPYFNYNAAGEVDQLISQKINLSGINNVQLYFDVSYARYSASFQDGLKVYISDDCGMTYAHLVYDKLGSDLATVSDQTTAFSPQAASDWRTEIIDLSPYSGSIIRIAFEGLNGYGNNLYLDNIRIIDSTTTAPFGTAIILNQANLCVGQSLQASTNAQTGVNYSWDFGLGANPNSATGPGPHSVSFATTGNRQIVLQAFNAGGQEVISNQVMVSALPVSQFNSIPGFNALQMQFNNLSQGAPFSLVSWSFGDGNTSNQNNPIHTYANGGNYSVKLKIENGCSTDSLEQNVYVSGLSVNQPQNLNWLLLPNPNNGKFGVQIPEGELITAWRIVDLLGREVMQSEKTMGAQDWLEFDISALENGVYMLEWNSIKGKQNHLIQKL